MKETKLIQFNYKNIIIYTSKLHFLTVNLIKKLKNNNNNNNQPLIHPPKIHLKVKKKIEMLKICIG